MSKYCCEKCVFSTNHSQNYKSHLLSNKHINGELKYNCDICNKKYKTVSGLYKHKNSCIQNVVVNNIEQSDIISNTEMISNEILLNEIKESNKQIAVLTNMVIELTKKQMLVPTTNNITSNNTSFIVYLNTNCSEAMNMKDFLRIVLNSFTSEELKNMTRQNIDTTLTDTILKQLNELAIDIRPLHCKTNIHNEEDPALYIKDKNKWNVESESHSPILDDNMEEFDEYFYGRVAKNQGEKKTKATFTGHHIENYKPEIVRLMTKSDSII
jgi:hypothetical protein